KIGKDTYQVTSHDAHAWPEIYLQGMGWTHLFDPTPGQQGATTGGSNLPHDDAVASPTIPTVPPPTQATTPATGNTTPGNPTAPSAPTSPVAPTLAPAPTSSSSSTGAWLPVLVVLALVVLVLGGYVVTVLG